MQDKIQLRTMALMTAETDCAVELAAKKQKLIDNGPLIDPFDMGQVAEADARLYAIMVERQSLERAVSALAPTPSWRLVLDDVVRQMTDRQLCWDPRGSSPFHNESALRRNFALIDRTNRLRDALTGMNEDWS